MRCAEASDRRGEPMVGTASTVRDFLLVECPGAWGADAPQDSRLPAEVKEWFGGLRGIRTLLIRRGRATTTRVFRAREGALRTIEVPRVQDVVGLDLSTELTPYDGQLFLVCTHGRHDTCCAERGRPLWEAMRREAPEETWQVSHIGGDRFAGNVLVLPDGLYYGRLTPADAAGFAATQRAGRLDLEHLRGRCRYPFPAQAAEVFLRRELGADHSTPFELVSGGASTVVFAVDGRRWQVEVVRTTTRELLTCKASEPAAGWTFAMAGITELED